MEKDLFSEEFKLGAYKKVDMELEELVKERKASVSFLKGLLAILTILVKVGGIYKYLVPNLRTLSF
jgi:hypothetical protein